MEGNTTTMSSHHQVTPLQALDISTNEETKERDTAPMLQSVIPETEPQPEDILDLPHRSVQCREMPPLSNSDSKDSGMSQDLIPRILLPKQRTKKKIQRKLKKDQRKLKKDPPTVVLVKGMNNKEKPRWR
eukprot:11404679-Ditylum_brightwellii.AAC.1